MEPGEHLSFGAWLRQSRRALDLTQDELARAVGCAKGTVRKLETDELRPSKQLAGVLADHFGIAAAERDAFVRFARGGAPSQPTAPARSSDSSPWREPSRHPSNLPVALTSFVGRTEELAELRRLFATTRLLTLTGTGGIGKTRLALQFAGGMHEAFRDGVWLVEFAGLASPESIPETVATALGVRAYPGMALVEALKSRLRTKTNLLILDNCEHLIQPIAQVAEELLLASPGLKVIATSREALGIRGEMLYQVPPLGAPKVPMLPTAANLQPEAVRLFIDRAEAVQPNLTLNGETAPLIASICMRLDGIPLAIELAAARTRFLSLDEISARLDDRFRLLTGGSRTALPRQRTLQATLEWSYALLSETERIMLGRLAVFSGGWTLEAAERVCEDERLPADQVFDVLSKLVGKSLVEVLEGAERYRMLETIRQYAGDRALESDDLSRVRDRHLAFFIRLAEESEPQLRLVEQVAWLNRLEVEHENLRAALDWSRRAAVRAESGLRLAAALASFCEVRGYLTEGREYLSAALPSAQGVAGMTVRAKAHYYAGLLAYMQGDYPAARAALGESISIYRQMGDAGRKGLADDLIMLGDTETEGANYEQAFALINEGLDIMRAVQDPRGIGRALWHLGACAIRVGDFPQALRHFQQGLPFLRQIGAKQDIAIALSGMAEIAVREGDYEHALQLEQESMTLRREIDDRWGIGVSLGNLAWIALLRGDRKRAVDLLAESLTVRGEIGDRGGIAWCIEKLAEVELLSSTQGTEPGRRDALRNATRLIAAATALRESVGSMIDGVDRRAHEERLVSLRAQLNPTEFEAVWADGYGMSLEQATASAVALAEY